MSIFYEDIEPGDVAEFGEYEVTEAEIVDFAERYDPQWFHVDPERAAEESMYGGLIASGWHTTAMTMRMLVDHHFAEAASLGAKGIEEIRWRRPVRPGDVLSVRAEVLDKEPERPDRGLVRNRTETRRDDGEVVLSMVSLVMYARRSDED
ncbi:MaoC family dehydratase [Halegenticoccus tardaugens]|uniref:MaoC family dehydratase n=1 Tax=Halegenticoccus tardaugens TaxID=2071624 RepID=UPI00100BA1D6|nr:MaoC family dehydratase [Halegenticoccus tardaugens]